jgi:rod shape-determining protein MreC
MVALVTVSLAVITVDYRQGASGPLEGMGKVALGIITPMQEAVSHVTRPIGNFLSAIAHLPSLQRQNDQLRAELAQARSQLTQNQISVSRLSQLEAIFKMQQTLNAPMVAGVVIGYSPSNFQWTVTIDRGSSDGVTVGDAVVAPQGLVGHVVSTTPYSSEVQLIIDPNSKVYSEVLSSTPVTGLLVGNGENDMKLTLVGQGQPVQVTGSAAYVVTKGYTVGNQSGLYPPGLLIGKVDQVTPVPGALDEVIAVRPTVDFANLDVVSVVLSTPSG